MSRLSLVALAAGVAAGIDYLVDPFSGKPAVLAALAMVAAILAADNVPEYGRTDAQRFAVNATVVLTVAASAVAIMWGVS